MRVQVSTLAQRNAPLLDCELPRLPAMRPKYSISSEFNPHVHVSPGWLLVPWLHRGARSVCPQKHAGCEFMQGAWSILGGGGLGGENRALPTLSGQKGVECPNRIERGRAEDEP